MDTKGHSLSLPRQMTHPKPLELKMPGLRGEPLAGEGVNKGVCVGVWGAGAGKASSFMPLSGSDSSSG